MTQTTIRRKPFTVSSDTSDYNRGVALRNDDAVVGYVSPVLTSAEQKYLAIKYEYLVIVLAPWIPCLIGQQLCIETDHKPLQ